MKIKNTNSLRLLLVFILALPFLLWPARDGGDIILRDSDIDTLTPVQEIPAPVVSSKPVPDVPVILKKIAWCESQNQQFNPDGSVHRGKINPQDTGKFQINEHYHLEASIALGMDIYTLVGNTEYAKYLYNTQGTTPWNWSRHCWSDVDRVWWEKGGEYWSE